MSLRLLSALLASSLLLAGCSQDAAFVLGDSSADVHLLVGGGFRVAEGEAIPVWLYDVHQGFETQGWTCDADGVSVTSADPTIASVRDTGRTTPIDVNAHDVDARVFTLHGERAGETTVTARCDDHERTVRVVVVSCP